MSNPQLIKRKKKALTEYDPNMQELLLVHQASIEADEAHKKKFFEMFELFGELKYYPQHRNLPAYWKDAQVGDLIRTVHNIYRRIK